MIDPQLQRLGTQTAVEVCVLTNINPHKADVRVVFLPVAIDPAERDVVRRGNHGAILEPGSVSALELLHEPFPSAFFLLGGCCALEFIPGRIEQPPFAVVQPTYERIDVTCEPTAEYGVIAIGNDR